MIQKPWKVQKDPCQRTSIKTSPTRNQIPSLQQILWHTKLYVNHLSPPENSWDWWSLHPIPRSCHPFLKGHTWDTWIQKIESILDLSTHSDQPLFFGGGEGNRFMSVNDSFFFAPERDQLLCWGHLWPVVQHGSNWVVTSIIASNCFWVAKTLVHNVFLSETLSTFLIQ